MTEDFQKPFAAPPTIFGVALIISAAFGFFVPFAMLPMLVQLSLGPLLIVAGGLIIRSSIREIAAADTTYDPFDVSTNLVASGVYQYSRNPGYLGLAVIQVGFAVLLDNIWVAIAALVAALITTVFVIRLEEKKLMDAFGEPYLAYKSQVRRWI